MRLTPARALATALLLGAGTPMVAFAQTTFDFANLKYTGTPKVNSGFLPTNGVPCTGGDLCSAKGGPLNFTKNGFTVDAYGFHNGNDAMVVQDHENGYTPTGKNGAGLGVYHQFNQAGAPNNSSDDNITFGEMLKLQFSTLISLQSIDLRSEGHNVTGWTTNSRFEYSTNGTGWTSVLLPANTGTFSFGSGGLNTSTLYVRFAEKDPDQFYLSAATVASVPEPNTVLCVGTGLLGLAAMARRRRRA